MFEKNESLRNLDFQCIIVTKLELRHSSKYLQTFTMITDNTTLCQCNCSSYSKYQSLPLSWAFTISAPPDKTSNLLHELFQSVTFPIIPTFSHFDLRFNFSKKKVSIEMTKSCSHKRGDALMGTFCKF